MDFSSLSGKQLVKGQEARALGPRETDMSSVTCVQSKAGRAALTSLREPRLRIPPRCALWTLLILRTAVASGRLSSLARGPHVAGRSPARWPLALFAPLSLPGALPRGSLLFL